MAWVEKASRERGYVWRVGTEGMIAVSDTGPSTAKRMPTCSPPPSRQTRLAATGPTLSSAG